MYNLLDLLGPNGSARRFMKNAPNGGSWVDDFCDQILNEIISVQEVSALRTKYGAYVANACKTHEGRIQLNVKWHRDCGWLCFTADTVDEAMKQLWSQENMVTKLKEN